MVIEELNKKKDEISEFITRLETLIEEKKMEIAHLDNTIKIFENDTINEEDSQENPNVIKHDFNDSIDIKADTNVSNTIKQAMRKQSQKVQKLHSDEKEILKQFKQLMRG